MECTVIDTEWEAAKLLGTKCRGPPYPLCPKRPLKPKDGQDLGYPMAGPGPVTRGSAHAENQDNTSENQTDSESEAAKLPDSINSVRISLW